MMKSRMFAVSVLLAAAAFSTRSAGREAGLQSLLDAELARFPAKAGIYVKHLKTGEEAAVRGDETFNSASVIKIPIMTLAYQLAEQGKVKLDARVTMTKADYRGGSGVLRYSRPRPAADRARSDHADDHHQRQQRDRSDDHPGGRRRARERLVEAERLQRPAAEHDDLRSVPPPLRSSRSDAQVADAQPSSMPCSSAIRRSRGCRANGSIRSSAPCRSRVSATS